MKLTDYPTAAEQSAFLQGALSAISDVTEAFRTTTTREAALDAIDGQLGELIKDAEAMK